MEKMFNDIHEVLGKRLVRDEYPDTAQLIDSLGHVWEKKYFTRDEFLAMCTWKEPRQRSRKYWQQHSEDTIHTVSARALSAPDDARRLLHLCRLKGVATPVASAILTLINPQDYGVIDIRVWQLLSVYGEVDYDTDGTWLTALHWLDYLDKIREWSQEFGVSARMIEQTLFRHHVEIQTEPLP